jgi:crotonobetainyl-CoA:carnitine CoA-transferase CaiB-like acyl-CoA transferase
VVVELGTSVAAPTAAMIFAELGAEVIKIENPARGDDARAWGPPFVDGDGSIFVAVNRNKRSAAIDFKDKRQCAALRQFILTRADIVLQNLRAGVVEQFGLDGASLTAEKPALIYCNLSAFGDAGPRAGRPGYDPLMQACGGLMSVTGEEGRPPVRVGPAIIDQGAAMWMAIGILSALHRRAATGRGGVISSSLYETALFWMGVPTASFLASKQVPRRMGTENGNLAPYKAFETKDGWVVICAGNDQQFAHLAGALGHPEWASDPDFRSNAERVKNRERINALVADIVKTKTRDHWQATLDAAGVPCAPMLGLDEVLAHPQSRALGMLQDAPDGGMPLMGLPLRFDGERPPFRASPPRLGEATDIVLGDAHDKAAE